MYSKFLGFNPRREYQLIIDDTMSFSGRFTIFLALLILALSFLYILEREGLRIPLELLLTDTDVIPPLNVSTNLLAGTYGCLIGPAGLQVPRALNGTLLLPSGRPKAASMSYSRTLVIPRLATDDTSWIERLSPEITVALYTVDDPSAAQNSPKNKGHEVMVYLSHIIDYYDELSDITIFMHSHRQAWHNSELLGFDAVEMVNNLRSEMVTRQGYFNMRCAWDPGCPEWLHPHTKEELLGKQEQTLVARHWHELFPLDDLPPMLSQPCCAQFAVSKERILAIPLARFIFYRDWLLKTALSDYVSGRIWEFTWQYVFTGYHTFCPSEYACYCQGFGMCFGGRAQYDDIRSSRIEKVTLESELKEIQLRRNATIDVSAVNKGGSTSDRLNVGRYNYMKDRIQAISQEIESKTHEALGESTGPSDKS